jgi:hypothetical protein
MMARKVAEWESKSGRRGFIQEEGVFSKELVVYEKKGLFGFGAVKLGVLKSNLSFEETKRELEKIVGEKVKIL